MTSSDSPKAPRPSRPSGGIERRKRPLVVAIDGPAASGKSSTAKWVARELGIRHVDSGSLYRSATYAALRREADTERWTEAFVVESAQAVHLEPGATTFLPQLGGESLTTQLTDADVTRNVSRVAQMPSVRAWVNDLVRATAEALPVVVDGRDIGTAVFPHARVKIFLVADPWERARRRLVQRYERQPNDDEIAAEVEALIARDSADATQLQQAKDAVLMDTTHLTQGEQVERIVALAKRAMR